MIKILMITNLMFVKSSVATLPGLENQFDNQALGDLWVKLEIKGNYNISLRSLIISYTN